MLTFGVTGGSGGGKTTLLRVWETLGCVTIDADKLYHALLAGDDTLLRPIAEAFPHAFTDGVLDRKQLGRLVFADKGALSRLEAITHPAVLSAVQTQLNAAKDRGAPAAAVDAVRLLESPLAAVCDVIIAVTAPLDTRLARIMARDGVDEGYARARIAAQPGDDFHRTKAHIHLENHGDTALFEQGCKDLYTKLLRREIP